jgi:hypothetical protein
VLNPVGEQRTERTACEEKGCRRSTRNGKPFCSDHVEKLPYATNLVDQLKAQEVEIEEVRVRGSRVVDVEGLTSQEILSWLRAHGARTVPRLAREIQVDVNILGFYVTALAESGLVQLVKTERRGPIVRIPPPEDRNVSR